MPVPDALLPTADAAAALAVALGCGLLVGIERERRKGQGPQRAFAGLRTFVVASLCGAATALTQIPGLVVAGALLVVGLSLLAYWRDRSDDPGVTTEMALLLVYLVGVLCAVSLPLAAGLAVGLTALLAGRDRLHRLALQWLRPGEARDGIILAALALMALPLVPDRDVWNGLVNPHSVLRLLVLLLAVQSLAHMAGRLLAARHAVVLAALASGFVSSTATIASMGLAGRRRALPACAGARPVGAHRAGGGRARVAQRLTGSRMVTNSSAAVGWMPMVASNTALVAPAFMATAKPCTISPASAPTMCRPTTRSLAVSTTSFIRVRSLLPESVWRSALNSLRKTVISPKRSRACASLRPTVPMLGWVNTAVGMYS